MDWPNVYALGRHLEALFQGSPLEKAYSMGEREYFFAFRRHKRGMRLLLDPKEPHVLVQEKPAAIPEEPSPFAMVVRKHLERGKLKKIRVPAGERLLWFDFDPGAMVMELLPRTPNLIVIWDGFAMGSHAPLERPKGNVLPPGSPYVKPVRREAPADLWRLGEADVNALWQEADPGRSGALGAALPYLPEWFLRDIAFRVEEGAAPWPAFEGMRAELHDSPPQAARLYRKEKPPGEPPRKTDVILSPFPLRSLDGWKEESFADYFDALAAWSTALGRAGFLDTPASAALRRLRHALERSEGAMEKVKRELDEARRAWELRRRGELMLIAMSHPDVRGGAMHVMDIYEEPPRSVAIPLDESKTLAENAEACFRRARRLEAALPRIEARLGQLERECSALRERIAAVEADPERAAELVPPPPASPPREGMERKAPSRIPKGLRAYRSSDGYVIYVGKDAKANERLTLKVARPHDLWLHAHGYGGSHVVVMNPRKGKEIPARTLREAAELAAWWSQGRPNRRLDVVFCERRQVRKRRGAPTGQVTLRAFETIRAEPKLALEETRDV
jgi:predicted ribosome quality control (RQC) complex YloA/Tae2 family protein